MATGPSCGHFQPAGARLILVRMGKAGGQDLTGTNAGPPPLCNHEHARKPQPTARTGSPFLRAGGPLTLLNLVAALLVINVLF
jgi:hypothetical protein